MISNAHKFKYVFRRFPALLSQDLYKYVPLGEHRVDTRYVFELSRFDIERKNPWMSRASRSQSMRVQSVFVRSAETLLLDSSDGDRD
ncbi:hypothetical protein WR30_00080 [Burkholderia contaminans FFH2055]|nr:hypothetical protein WR30_00080 [Burkholderia contaminans FFH2055]